MIELSTKKQSMKLFIKNMVCIRCKMVVKEELARLGLHCLCIELGEVEILERINSNIYNELKIHLLRSGLELMDDKKTVLIQQIKNLIIDLVHYSIEPLTVNLSDYLSEKLNHDYTYMANLFSEVQGITIEKFLISHKIERVKELLVYNEQTLTEIAYQMHYSSVAHLSSQFKKFTGSSPSDFKVMKSNRRKMLEEV